MGIAGVLSLCWSNPKHQGLVANVHTFGNSSIMHSGMPEECLPAIFHDGMRVVFPSPQTQGRVPPRTEEQVPTTIRSAVS